MQPLTHEEEQTLTALVERALEPSLHCWVATRQHGRSASMNCDYANVGLLRAFDAMAERAIAALREDAERWRALFVNGGRVRLLGSAGLGNPARPDKHIGLELWSGHSAGDDSDSRAALTQYADEVRAAVTQASQPEGA